MFNTLQEIIYQFSNVLLWPCCLLLIIGVIHTLYLFGSFFVEGLQRRGRAQAFSDPLQPAASMLRRAGIVRYIRQRELDPGCSAWLALDRTEASLAASVDRARFWIRVGPALGLAGTLIPLGPALIPLGPALMALAENNLKALSSGLILAFGTTVLGLFSGALGWIIASAQERWYRLDLAEIRHALESADA